jgi:hypothetical protein
LAIIWRFLGVEDTEVAPWGTVETEFHPIHSAARMRDVATVLKELESGVDVDFVTERAKNGDGGNTALWFAAQDPWPGGIEVAKVLVDAGAGSIDGASTAEPLCIWQQPGVIWT